MVDRWWIPQREMYQSLLGVGAVTQMRHYVSLFKSYARISKKGVPSTCPVPFSTSERSYGVFFRPRGGGSGAGSTTSTSVAVSPSNSTMTV